MWPLHSWMVGVESGSCIEGFLRSLRGVDDDGLLSWNVNEYDVARQCFEIPSQHGGFDGVGGSVVSDEPK